MAAHVSEPWLQGQVAATYATVDQYSGGCMSGIGLRAAFCKERMEYKHMIQIVDLPDEGDAILDILVSDSEDDSTLGAVLVSGAAPSP